MAVFSILFRNQSWFLSHIYSDDEKLEFIQTMVSDFLDEVFADIQDMTHQESGWTYYRIVLMDVRFLKRDAHNLIHTGRGKKAPFDPEVKRLFDRHVHDPADYLQIGFEQTHLCVPASIILCIRSKLGMPLRQLTKKQMSSQVNCIPWRSYITVGKKGMPLEMINSFEKALSPVPKKLIDTYPAMAVFKGIALNVFVIRKTQQHRRLFPIGLSPKSRDKEYFQADLLLDNDQIRPSGYVTNENHCLAIGNLAILLTRFSEKKGNYARYNNICRSCGWSGLTKEKLENHYTICGNKTRGPLGRRKCNNIIVHRPFVVNRFTKKQERNGVTFSRGHNYMMLRATSISFLDFESYNRALKKDSVEITPSIFGNAPKSAVFEQDIMCYAYTNVSLQQNHPLPENLAKPRFKRLDDENVSPNAARRDFYIALLLSLRLDLLLTFYHLKSIWEKDRPPPPSRSRTSSQIQAIQRVAECQLCGAIFGRTRKAPSGRKYRITACWDHCHYGLNNNLRMVLCQVQSI